MAAHPVSKLDSGRGGRIYGALYRLFEHPAVFRSYQAIVDGGKQRQIRRFLTAIPHDSILDVGCGTGNWARLASGAYLGVDTSVRFIEACRKRFANDPAKRFVLADASELDSSQRYDLGIMVSVLHHVSDQKAEAILTRLSQVCTYVFVLDLYPIPWNPVSRALYALDRGDFIRTPQEQRAILDRVEGMRIVKESSFYSPTFVYRHTMFLVETPRKMD